MAVLTYKKAAASTQSEAGCPTAMILRGGSGWAVVMFRHIPGFGVTVSPRVVLPSASNSAGLSGGVAKWAEPVGILAMAPSNGEGSAATADALQLDKKSLQPIFKPQVFSASKDNVRRIFGTSQVFQGLEESKPKFKKLTVPLKVKENYRQGLTLLEQEDWETAVLFLSRALHLNPKLVEFYVLRAEAYIHLCDFSSAAQNLRRACSFEPENTKYLERLTLVLYLQGQCLFEQCAYQDALDVFSQASELQPQKSCFHYQCMACLLALRRHQDCLTCVTKLLKHGTAKADIYILRARLYNFFHKPSLCYQDLHKALRLEPTHPQAKALLGTMVNQAQEAYQDAKIFAVQGNMQSALQCINSAIENNPLDASFFLFRGTMYRRVHEYDGAVEDFLKALDMLPASQENMVQQVQRQLVLAYNDFAVHCYMQGAYQEAALLLNKALRDEQQEKSLYVNRGDCFFQLGHLAFAEADYQQALMLSPQDQDAKLRMAMLQEKMGFCEQKRSKLFPLMTNLFPGMSADEVLGSQMGCLAKLQLKRMLESDQQFDIPKGIIGLLKERELERQKAHALQKAWKPEQPSSEELETTSQDLKEVPEKEAEVLEETEKCLDYLAHLLLQEEPEQSPDKETSLSSSNIYPSSSSSILDYLATSTSETQTSTICQEYRSTSATAVTLSDSSVKIQSSDSEINMGDQSLSHSTSRMTGAHGQPWSLSKAKDFQHPQQKLSKTKDTHHPRQRPRKAEETQNIKKTFSKTEDTQGPRWRLSKIEDAQDQRWRPKTEGTQGPRRRPKRVKASQGRSWGSNKFLTYRHTRALDQSSSKTKDFCDLNQTSTKTDATQHRSQRFSKAEVDQIKKQRPSQGKSVQDWSWDQSSSLDQMEVFCAMSQKPSKVDTAQDQSQRLDIPKSVQSLRLRLSKDESTQDWRQPSSPRPCKIKGVQDTSQSCSKTEAGLGVSPYPWKTESTQSWSQESRLSLSKTESIWGPSPNPSKSVYSWKQSSSAIKGLSQSPSNTMADQDPGPSQNPAP
ncbi:PREDICTED: tetratricopeptide repeat protein 16 [Elephantulus edwardii]|uniref:tetratricopeptide repeat protein 16 n=1 Tax=Elephantulus edwardii TaxID=28737 RepID=UPI0003F0E112|nr:PREDICTED: tetratricopeptide repeat protein 16 [Elephantulus edwardii]